MDTINLTKQGRLSSNIFIESPATDHIVDGIHYEILENSDGLTIVDSSGEAIYTVSSMEGIAIEEILDYLAGLSSVNDIALSGQIALRFSDSYAVANEFVEI